MTAYYNEIDPKAAAWLRQLIRCGHIAPGEVDERSIEDVVPTDLAGFRQCHFFAGIGVWSYALRGAGWADDRPVWTGSCPCQPFSAAGKGAGFADERHLWPAFHHLISECRPPVVFGEQVASKDGLGWLDLVQADLEGSGYASGAVDLCAAGVGAPHIRQRLWWVGERLADAEGARRWPDAGSVRGRETAGLRGAQGPHGGRAGEQTGRACDSNAIDLVEHASGDGRQQWRAEPSGRGAAGGRSLGGLADTLGQRGRGGELGREDAADARLAGETVRMAYSDGWDASAEREQPSGEQRQQPQDGGTGGLADAEHALGWPVCQHREDGHHGPDIGRQEAHGLAGARSEVCRPGPVNGVWRDADWLYCRDGKWRPVESGTFPLAHGAAERVGRLRGYGNAIVAPAAQAFIEAVMA